MPKGALLHLHYDTANDNDWVYLNPNPNPNPNLKVHGKISLFTHNILQRIIITIKIF